MNKQIIYLYPEQEGQQHWVCWGLQGDGMDKRGQERVKQLIMEALNEIKEMVHSELSQRSFTVGIGEKKGLLWVAIPRQLSVKVIDVFNKKLKSLQVPMRRVITSYQNPFGQELPFQGKIFYDCGFIVDSTVIDEKVNEETWVLWNQSKKAMNQ